MLLTMKPMIYAANVADSDLGTGNEMSRAVFDLAAAEGSNAVLVSAQVCLSVCGYIFESLPRLLLDPQSLYFPCFLKYLQG